MRKILIATPLKGEIPPEYVRTLISILSSKVPDTKFIYAFLGGTTVQWARDELVSVAVKYQCTHILFWDKDLEAGLEHALRLMSHDVDAVSALYTKRHLSTVFHVHGDPKYQDEQRADGLMRVLKVAIGFSLIKVSVFERMRAFFPERIYYKCDAGEEPVILHEFFPMGIIGKNSNDGKLRRIRAVFEPKDVPVDVVSAVQAILKDTDYSENQIRGEDFYFCELALEAGIELYVDPALIIPHKGEVTFPIPTKQLNDMVREPWRQDEVRALSTSTDEEIIPA
jgi:hypothetical protein